MCCDHREKRLSSRKKCRVRSLRRPSRRRASRVLVFLLSIASLAGPPGCAYYHARSPGQRISYEDRIGREFALEVSGQLRLMDEPEILDFSRRLGERIASNVTGSPYSYNFFVVRDPTMNAFAVPGGYIYVFAGLLATVGSVEELAGVLAHEVTHVEGNHFIRGQKKLDVTNIATVAATILAAALGGGEQAAAVGTLAQAAQISAALHYSREFEREADRSSIPLMRASGFDPKGILSLFETFEDEARLNASDLPPYFLTHPLPLERIYEVRSWIETTGADKPKTELVKGFDTARLTAKLRTEEEQKVLSAQEAEAMKDPSNARAQFLLGYLYLKLGNLPLAANYLEKALQLDSSRADHALYLARAHYLAGRMEQAEDLVLAASRLEPDNALVEILHGDILLQRGGQEEAMFHYQKAVAMDPGSSFAQLNLAMAYGRGGQTGKSYLHIGLASKKAGQYLKALYYFKKAQRNLDSASADAKLAEEEIRWMED